MYTWKDEETGYTLDIMRSFREYRDEPKDDDLPEEERGKKRKWRRVIQSAEVHRPPGWGGKGHWGNH